jgi:hypothetical protein
MLQVGMCEGAGNVEKANFVGVSLQATTRLDAGYGAAEFGERMLGLRRESVAAMVYCGPNWPGLTCASTFGNGTTARVRARVRNVLCSV